MPTISQCPRCDAQVSLPQGAPGDAEVRCPLCSEEYLLQEAWEKAPPELILLNVPTLSTAADATGDATDSGQDEHLDFGTMFGSGDDGQDELRLEGETEQDDKPFSFDDGPQPNFSFGGEGGGTATATSPTMTATVPAPRRKRRGPGPVMQMVGVFGGGVIGLTAAYFILLWFIGINLVPALTNMLPSFMVPEKYRAEATVSNDTGKTTQAIAPAKTTGLPEGGEFTGPGKSGTDDGDSLAGAFSHLDDNDPPATDSSKTDATQVPVDDPFGTGGDPSFPKVDPGILDPGPPNPAGEVVVQLKNPPSYTSDELGEALGAAGEALKEFDKAEPASDPQLFAAMAKVYSAYAPLAERMTFTAEDPSDPMLINRQLAAAGMGTKIDAGQARFDFVGRLANFWLKGIDKKPCRGIVLAGTVDDVKSLGAGSEIRLILAGESVPVVVIAPGKVDAQPLQEVIVMGYVVSMPKQNIAGYSGDAEAVVWALPGSISPKD